jgi:hypothetical protein
VPAGQDGGSIVDREVRNQKYAGIERTEADLRDAKAALEDFSNIAVRWLQASHAALLK